MGGAPIDPEDYIYGVKVVDIGDLRIARGKSRRPKSTCTHLHMVYDQQERRIWCSDCESDVDAFDAGILLVENWHRAQENHRRREQEIKEAEQHSLISVAAKVLDKAWRSRSTAPCCPHCKEAIFPEDVARGVTQVSKQFVAARRKRDQREDGV